MKEETAKVLRLGDVVKAIDGSTVIVANLDRLSSHRVVGSKNHGPTAVRYPFIWWPIHCLSTSEQYERQVALARLAPAARSRFFNSPTPVHVPKPVEPPALPAARPRQLAASAPATTQTEVEV